MNKLYKCWFWVSLLAIGFLAGCTYVKAKNDIPNLGILKPISWESQDDPNYGNGYIQKFILHDTESNHDYIVVETARGDIAITGRN